MRAIVDAATVVTVVRNARVAGLVDERGVFTVIDVSLPSKASACGRSTSTRARCLCAIGCRTAASAPATTTPRWPTAADYAEDAFVDDNGYLGRSLGAVPRRVAFVQCPARRFVAQVPPTARQAPSWPCTKKAVDELT
jgi:hypothetical protein